MFEMTPIGYVASGRSNIEDDYWGGVEARITLAEAIGADALDGIEEFSHAEIIYFFDKVDPAKIVSGARHPRNNPAWPKVGIFAQRGKNRPNRIGSTIMRILWREGSTLHVSGLDAIDGTPVLDIRPVMAEFLPREPVVQPPWSHELMKVYWEKRSAFQPVIDALQIKPIMVDLTQQKVLLLEGIYDYYALELFRQGRNVSILPSVGADSIAYYIFGRFRFMLALGMILPNY